MNEEEVKVKIVLPFLERLGFTASQLQLETSFFIRVGRQTLEVNSGRSPKQAGVGARLDILVKRNQDNLFVVETKERGLELTVDDCDQAVSYARLVHPIAPFALISNGGDWKLFDSISKIEILPSDFKIKGRYDITLPENLRSEAASYFLGFSVDNVRRFCAAQVASSLNPLLGSATDLTKKFVPELHVPDDGLKTELHRFLAGNSAGFLIAAESGMGKTCELCYHANELLQNGENAVLLFQGYLIETGVAQAVAEEFNWTFPEQLGPVELFQRLEQIFKHRPIIVFIDAIDEWTYSRRLPSFFNFLKLAGDHRIKVVFTCKSASWTRFSLQQGGSTGIDAFLHHVKIGEHKAPEYVLRGFTPQTLALAIDKYSAVFGIRPQFEAAVIEEAQRNPFLLRVFYTVAKTSGHVQLTFSSQAFFKSYYRSLIDKTGNPEIAEAQLLAMAKVIWETNEDTAEMEIVRAKLGLGLNELLLPALFDFSILTKSSDHPARIGFYFQQLRDFIISFLLLKWPELDQRRLALAVEPLKRDGAQADVLSFYYRHASEEQRRVVDRPLFANAKKYLDLYKELIDVHFPTVRARFSPHTIDRIGFIAELLVSHRVLGAYGFRQIGEGDSEVLFVPVTRMFSGSNLMYLHGGGSLFQSGSTYGFVNIDVRKEVVENECERQLKSIADQQLLSEETAGDLMLETLAAIVLAQPHYFQELLREPIRTFQNLPVRIWVRELSFPFKWPDAFRVLLRRVLTDEFEQELLLRKATDHNEPEIPGIPGPVIRADESLAIQRKADGILASGARVQIQNGNLNATAAAVFHISNSLIRLGAAREWTWSDRGDLYNALKDDPPRGLATVKEYLVKLFTAFLASYKTVIEHNFPTLRSHFTLRQQMPICVFILLGPHLVEEVRTGRSDHRAVQILFCHPNQPITENTVKAIEQNDFSGKFPDCSIKGERHECFYMSYSSLYPLTFSSLASRGLGQLQQDLPVRKLVYEQIKRELPDALKGFRKICGV